MQDKEAKLNGSLQKATSDLYRPPPGYGFKPLKQKSKLPKKVEPSHHTEFPKLETPQRKSLLLTIPDPIRSATEVETKSSSIVKKESTFSEDPKIQIDEKTTIGTIIEPKTISHEIEDRMLQNKHILHAKRNSNKKSTIITPNPLLKEANRKGFADVQKKSDIINQMDHKLNTRLPNVERKVEEKIFSPKLNTTRNFEGEDGYLNRKDNVPKDLLNKLKMKQELMEALMRKLLKSLKELKQTDQTEDNVLDRSRERRGKIAKMMQVLILQRKNLQMQTEVLSSYLTSLGNKYELLRKQAESCIIENIQLNQAFKLIRRDLNEKDVQLNTLTETNSKLKQRLEIKSKAEVDLGNTEFELNRLCLDNGNLREENQRLEGIISEKVQDRESKSRQNTEIMRELKQNQIELSKMNVRCGKLSTENVEFRERQSTSEAEIRNSYLRKAEMDQLCVNYEQLQNNYLRLQKIYASELQARKKLNGQLQQECINPNRDWIFCCPVNEAKKDIIPNQIIGKFNFYQHSGEGKPSQALAIAENRGNSSNIIGIKEVEVQ